MTFRWSISVVAFATLVSTLAMAASPNAGSAMPSATITTSQVQTTETAHTSVSHALTAEDAHIFLDGMVPYAMARADIAGGVFVIVKDGKILFAKGYGYADLANHKPVVADTTIFRPGSVSKLFTWTAVMQLVEAGKIDLDRDVNDYLDFKIPEKFGKPITMRNLMTHTPGFEEGISKAFVDKTSDLFPLRDYLMNHIPARIYPPGEVVAYSNYGCSLAGYIVQRLSGEPFAEYVAHHILIPLGMNHSTLLQPLPPVLAPSMSKAYSLASNGKAKAFEAIETAPAGALSATGTDMAHFMIAHLEGGTYNGVSILKPETLQLMHSPQSRMAPDVNGYDLGFYQENRNGLRIIGHGGDTNWFHSDFHLLLDKNVGVFMSFNGPGKDGEVEQLRVALFRAFLDRYFPYSPPEERTVADPKKDAARVAGSYVTSRRITSALRLAFALTQSEVSADPDGTIKIDVLKDLAGNPKSWREVGPLRYREAGGQTHTQFVTDRNGNISYWISDDFLPVFTFQKVHGLEQMPVLKVMMGALAAALVLTIAIWIGGAIARYRLSQRLELPPLAAHLRFASRIGAVLLLTTMIAWVALFAILFGALTGGSGVISRLLMGLYVLSVLGALGAIAIIVEASRRIVAGPGGWLVRIGELVLGLTAVYAVWAIWDYGLANFSFTY